MSLTKIIREQQDRDLKLNESILVEYNLYFGEIDKKNCFFSVDDYEGLKEINKVISQIRKEDKEAEIYVNTYGINFREEPIYIYADTLWVSTSIELEVLLTYFEKFPQIRPSDAIIVGKESILNEKLGIVILSANKVEKYKDFVNDRKLIEIKSLYWD